MIYGQPLAFKCLAGLPRFGSHPSTHSAVPWTTCRDREFHSHSRCCDVLASDMHAHSGVITSRVPMAGMPQPARSCIARRCPILQTLTHRTQRVQSRQLLHTTVRAAVTDSGTVKMVVQGRQIELTPSIKSYAQEKVDTCCPCSSSALCTCDNIMSVTHCNNKRQHCCNTTDVHASLGWQGSVTL